MKPGRDLDALVAEKVCKKCGSARRMWLKSGYTQCADCHNARGRAYQRLHRRKYPYNKTLGFKSYQRKWQLKRRYGITAEQYDEMLRRQNGLCAICRATSRDGRTLVVDHCHKTGEVRGLLCNPCNVGLANFRDNMVSLVRAIEYLKTAPTPSAWPR